LPARHEAEEQHDHRVVGRQRALRFDPPSKLLVKSLAPLKSVARGTVSATNPVSPVSVRVFVPLR